MVTRRHRRVGSRAVVGACALTCLLIAVSTGASAAQSPPIAADAPFTPKVRSLLYASAPGRPAGEGPLTVDEKISLVHGLRPIPPDQALGQAGYTPGVPRLGIPDRRDADALGINVATQTTAPPTKMAIGASFSRSAAAKLGHLEGVEGRAVRMDLLYGR
jgi:beta-glucosidase